MFKLIFLPLAVLIMLLFSACSSSGQYQWLTERIWLLTELDGKSPLPSTTVTAEFDPDGSIGGTSGCNSYSGSYTVEGKSIAMGPFVSTLMACPDLVMDQETRYLKALENAVMFQINADELTLEDADGNNLALFSALEQGLSGTAWDVIAYNNGKEAVVSVMIGTEITALFGEDGQLTGNAGCNDYFTSYETDGDQIAIGLPGVTRKFCSEPVGMMEQEQAYLTALQTAATYKIMGMDMEMRTSGGAKVASLQRKLAP